MQTILVGLDGSPRAAHVLDRAIDLAHRVGAKLHLYRAVGIPAEVPAPLFTVSPSEVGALLERHALDELRALASSVPPGELGGVRVSIAVPWQGVCEAAQLVDADLIVIGSHGYGGLDRLLGTTAAKIVNHAERSVLVVKEGRGSG